MKRFTFLSLIVLFSLFLFIQSCDRRKSYSDSKYDQSTDLRPDVVEWINSNFEKQPRRKRALTILATAHQYILSHSDDQKGAAKKLMHAMDCYHVAFEENKNIELPYFREVSARTFNTVDRAKARIVFEMKAKGVYKAESIKSWEAECEK